MVALIDEYFGHLIGQTGLLQREVMKATADSILIVDDDASNRELLDYYLSSDYQCVLAESAEQAVGILLNKRFNMVITDLNMPGASGFDLCRAVKQRWPDTAVLIISGAGDGGRRSEARGVGAVEYLTKPVDRGRLGRTIKFALQSGKEMHGGKD